MTTSTELTVRSALPQLPMQVHPVVGTGLVESDLILSFPKRWSSASAGMNEWLASHRAEQTPFRACFWMKPHRDDPNRAVVLFIPGFERCKHWVVGVTKNDPLAARILLANARAGYYLSGVRWELYADSEMEELLDMGCFHQWDLLGDVSTDRLVALEREGIKPQGDWDYHQIIWRQNCSICGQEVGVNSHVFNIDSVVCANCGNRPFLSRAIHGALDTMLHIGNRDMMADFSRHAIQWIAGVHAQLEQVRQSSSDVGGARLKQEVWQHSLVAQVADPENAMRVRGLIEQHGVDFEMYQAGCRILKAALLGETPFREEQQITLNYVMASTQLIQQRRLTTVAKSN